MSKKEEYWEGIIKSYETSGLSQESYCQGHGVGLYQFKYYWRRLRLSRKAEAKPVSATQVDFEPVVLSTTPTPDTKAGMIPTLLIRFSNAVSCEVKLDIKGQDFTVLLQQLRSLC